MKDSISAILRQRRKPDVNGNCRDTARCIIRINGKKKYYSLGRYGSPEAEKEYNRLKAEFEKENTERLPEGKTSDFLFDSYAAEFLQGKHLTADQYGDALAIQYARERFSPFLLSDFSMTHLVAFQSYLVRIAPEERIVPRNGKPAIHKRPWSRYYVNRLVKRFKKILVWGINNGFLSPMFRESIRLFPGITSANPRGLPERPRREAVRDSDVIATLPFLPPIVADMVKIQRAACLRPSEVCDLRVGDIVFSDSGTATVDKVKNKIARTGVHRQIAFGYAEQKILRLYCEGRKPEEFLFSMKALVEYQFQQKRLNRKTPMTPSQKQREIDRFKTRFDRFGENITSNVYARIVARAVNRAIFADAGVQKWTPYQLRHAAYSAISAQYGVDVASKVAGHLSPNLARVYDHSAAEVSQRVAADRKQGWWE